MAANDHQVAGQHYSSASQHWDMVAYNFGLGYFRGQVSKYICRWRKKNGVQDLEKALHFLQKLRELEARSTLPRVSICDFTDANDIPPEEAYIIHMLAFGGACLGAAETELTNLINREKGEPHVQV